ncbi:FAD-binding oxidoreductase [Solwaraspora sp. WMMD1047]|uniref:NAD(P)/FAD-dependent oxidoreductase n=1 Tax=Solwaraspora sp. WMMD1047 TaxID=3016102 RepID=UPI002416C19C|nr:FAD-binding oxidoreductase [Solwaraspora sp. WMMD1047]MDG4829360.1 FAD-binding oxidoreductase [Solwaraspora sp. WMMD1047]
MALLKRPAALRAPAPTAPVDVVVVGAGIIGAACADQLAAAGLAVTVVERTAVGAGTTGAGEGNILVSDKEPGPELDLALLANELWRRLGDELGPELALETKSGLVVATGDAELAGLHRLAADQATAGVRVERLGVGQARSLEPYLTPELAGAVRYPQDMQVQPVLAAALLLRRARRHGATLRTATTVTGIDLDRAGRVAGVRTDAGPIAAGWVVNAAGLAAGAVAALAGARLPIQPRRGYLLVTEPLPPTIRAKVYDAGYVSNVSSDDAQLQTSTVVEATDGGTILIGASRERVGLDPGLRIDVLARLARQAVRLFPVLAGVQAIRAYRGFRPYSPDHLPVIGVDPAVPGLLHAAGHEGAGIGLAPATGLLVRQLITGEVPALDPAPFRPGRPTLTPEPSDNGDPSRAAA